MKTKLSIEIGLLLLVGVPSFAHRLDEYLQASMISLEKDRVQVLMRLIPGVAVSPVVLKSIDTNSDGIISEVEGRVYAEHVLGDLSLSVDGHHLEPGLLSIYFPKIEEMKDGLGEIQIEFSAELPRAYGSNRKLIFENHTKARSPRTW